MNHAVRNGFAGRFCVRTISDKSFIYLDCSIRRIVLHFIVGARAGIFKRSFGDLFVLEIGIAFKREYYEDDAMEFNSINMRSIIVKYTLK